MGSLVYAGRDFGRYCSAQTVLRSATDVVPETRVVPGRAGALLLGGRLAPLTVRVRLFLELDGRRTDAELAAIRHEMAGWLAEPGGARLKLPEEPGYELRDAVVSAGADWDRLFEDGSCEVTFVAYDPIAWGETRTYAGKTSVTVGGTWATFPRFRLVAKAGSAVQAGVYGGAYVRVERAFAGGEVVVIDCAKDSVAVDGEDARECVTLTSDFFSLSPGPYQLAFSGVGDFTTYFTEKWV